MNAQDLFIGGFFFGSGSGGGGGMLIEVSTSAAMDALLTAENVGKAYKYTGTTDAKYTNGDIYVVKDTQA